MVDVLEVKIQEEVLSLIALHGPTLMSGTQKLLLSVTPSALTNSNVSGLLSFPVSAHIGLGYTVPF